MVAKNCTYNAAQLIVWKIFKEYHDVDLDSVADTSSGSICYTVQFPRERQRNTRALDIQGASELIITSPTDSYRTIVPDT
jgi:hypothetical protein